MRTHRSEHPRRFGSDQRQTGSQTARIGRSALASLFLLSPVKITVPLAHALCWHCLTLTHPAQTIAFPMILALQDQLQGQAPGGCVGVAVTGASGFDLDCVWRNQGQVASEKTAGRSAALAGQPPPCPGSPACQDHRRRCRIAMVGSANLTSRAMDSNLECGFLISGGPGPRAIRDHITELQARGYLVRSSA